MTNTQVKYIRDRAERLRKASDETMDDEVRSEYRHGARYLNLVADEIEAGFHDE